MFYLILAIDLVALGAAAALIVRLVRAPAERRKQMLRPKPKTILICAAGTVAVFLLTTAAILSHLGLAAISATSAAEDYLKAQFGPRDTSRIEVTGHIERSKKPAVGVYQIRYRYGEKEGALVAEYFERDGKLVFNISPKDR
jgi:hypothetical protein